MPGFADSFWSGDYAGGLGVLFTKLQQGVVENQQIIQIAKLRADAEELYGTRLMAIPSGSERAGGFGHDDGASVRKAFDGMKKEMEDAGRSHRRVADSIRELVIDPFSKWCGTHEQRVNDSHDDLQVRVKAYDKQMEVVKKLRTQYFNKCRMVEDLEEETKFIQVPQPETPKSGKAVGDTPQLNLPDLEDADDEDPLEIGDDYMLPQRVRKMLQEMLVAIPQGDVKVSILGTYQNCATGDQIVEYIMKSLDAASVSYAERIGQDLVSHGFLRLVGSVGNTFANSSKLNYQFRPKAFSFANVQPKDVPKKMNRTPTIQNGDGPDTAASSPPMAYVGDYLGNLLSSQHPNETPADKLRREGRETDERYKEGVKKLDLTRCSLEEAIIDHLNFMQRCELDRLKAIKRVILDFSGAISNVVPCIKSTVDQLMLYQETVQPLGDLRYMLESYRTGSFMPKVITYESYYNTANEQTFGVELEARARADRKRVPIILTTILTYLDHHYPDLEGDDARRGIWLVDVPLAATHHLRNAINNGKAPSKDILAKYEIPIVASVLKLYLLELPDSVVSNPKYKILKTVYSTHGAEGDDHARLAVIQNTLGSLPLTNIATLDALSTHFTRLIELTSADDSFVSLLAQSLAPCILRPRTQNALTQSERHSYRLVRDLFAHKEQIFGELKRASTVSSGSRARAVSTDESHRRLHAEARNQAVIAAAKSRSSSPAPPRHRRDRSVVAETRFPIQTSPTAVSSPRNSGGKFKHRDSLEVPGSTTSSQDMDTRAEDHAPFTNESEPPHNSAGVDVPSPPLSSSIDEGGISKRDSLSRSGPASSRFPRKNTNLVRSVADGKRDSMTSQGSLDGIASQILDPDVAIVNNRRSLVDEASMPVRASVQLNDGPTLDDDLA